MKADGEPAAEAADAPTTEQPATAAADAQHQPTTEQPAADEPATKPLA